MKKLFYTFLLATAAINAQEDRINVDKSGGAIYKGHSSTILNGLNTKPEGLWVYNSTTHSFWYWNGTEFIDISEAVGESYSAGNGLNLSSGEFSINNSELAPSWANITGKPTITGVNTGDLIHDETPTESSTNGVESGGVYDALALKASNNEVVKTAVLSPVQNLDMWYGTKVEFYSQSPTNDVIVISDSIQGVQDISGKADKSNVLQLNNTSAYTPTLDYNPATKKYVDDNIGSGEVETPTEEAVYGTVEVSTSVSGTKNLDLAAYSAFRYNLTGNTTLTDSNAPSSGKSTVKTLLVTSSDAYTLAFPSSWDRIVGTFVSAKINMITVSYINDGSELEVDAIITQMD